MYYPYRSTNVQQMQVETPPMRHQRLRVPRTPLAFIPTMNQGAFCSITGKTLPGTAMAPAPVKPRPPGPQLLQRGQRPSSSHSRRTACRARQNLTRWNGALASIRPAEKTGQAMGGQNSRGLQHEGGGGKGRQTVGKRPIFQGELREFHRWI